MSDVKLIGEVGVCSLPPSPVIARPYSLGTLLSLNAGHRIFGSPQL